MRMGRLAAVIAFSLTLIGGAAPLSAQNFATDIPLTSGGSERVLFAAGAAARAILIMLPGGPGIVGIAASGTTTNLNFLVRTLPLWLAQGFAVEILDAPNGTSLLGQRHTAGYVAAIDRAVDFARSRGPAPIWLLGTSQGSTAAANGAAHLGGKIAGVVLSSSVTRQGRGGETVFDSEPGLIAVPALVVANQDDTCKLTPPGDAPNLVAALARSPRKEVILVSSNQIQSDPCEAMSPHGYLGIEPAVGQRISDWIRATPGR
jgi:pimeloyl-ACP methyl ester carboxylesterase